MKTMGYLVITFPMGKRGALRDVAELRRVRRSVIRLLKARGFAKGLVRWHWFSEDQPGVYHPHLNLLFEAGFIAKGDMAELKRALAQVLGVPMVVVHYHYTASARRMVHWVRYVTRATFLDCAWDEGLADRLYRFNNMVSFSWPAYWRDLPDAWSLPPSLAALDAVRKLEAGICDECGAPITWFGGRDYLVKVADLPALGFDLIGGGYWREVRKVLGTRLGGGLGP